MDYKLCARCKGLDIERAVLQPDQAERAILGALDQICQRSSECVLCAFISSISLPQEKCQYKCFLSFRSKVKDVVSSGTDQSLPPVFYYELVLEFQDANLLYEGTTTLEPCAGSVPACKDTISESGVSIPWMSPRVVEPLLPVELLKSWIHTREDIHRETCASPLWAKGISWPQNLRLIDVERNCVVDVRENTRYVALSYVWGDTSKNQMRASKTIVKSMQVDGYLLGVDLPKTIMEAVALVRDLGERYIWVDCLCILQDDAVDLAVQIPQMDGIYAGAVLTIIAGSGDSSESGLAHYRSPAMPHPTQECRISSNTTLFSRFRRDSHDSVFLENPWMERGWTFQEYILSRRKIFFLKDRVYWQCESDFWDEGVVNEPRPNFMVTRHGMGINEPPLHLLKFETDLRWDSFARIFAMYKKRKFNPVHEYDVSNALQGVLRRLSSLRGDLYHWGVPQSSLEEWLLWSDGSSSGTERIKCKLALHNKSGETWRIDIPSWSWMARPGTFDTWSLYPENKIFGNPESDNFRNSLLDWFRVDVEGQLSLLERPLRPEYHYSYALPPTRWKPQNNQLSEGCRSDFKDSGLIRTVTSCATLTLKPLTQSFVSNLYATSEVWEYAILDEAGDSIGKIHGLSGYHCPDNTETVVCNFIVLSESLRSAANMKEAHEETPINTWLIYGRENVRNWAYPAGGSASLEKKWYLLHVMFVEWDEKREIAYRRGAWAVSEADWMEAGPESRVVTLG